MKAANFAKATLVCAATLALPPSAKAQDADFGKQIFDTYCANCHGEDAKGGGFFAEKLKAKPADLTVLQKNNGGIFPFQAVYDTIDGRKMAAAHGSREMPIWGDLFYETAPHWTGPFGNEEGYGSIVRGRILAVIGYLGSIQEK